MSQGFTARFAAGEPPHEETAETIISRLDRIESKLGGTTVPARVVDAGEDVTLLRLLRDTDLEHSQTVEVSIREPEKRQTDDEEDDG